MLPSKFELVSVNGQTTGNRCPTMFNSGENATKTLVEVNRLTGCYLELFPKRLTFFLFMDKLNEKASLSMSLTGFAYEFVQIYVLFWLWLSIYLCPWFQIFILFWHWFSSNCTRNLCLMIFRSCGRAFGSITGFNCRWE